MFNSVRVFCHQFFFVLISSISRACFMAKYLQVSASYMPPVISPSSISYQVISRFPHWILRVLHFSNPNFVFMSLLHISTSFKLCFSCWTVLLYVLTSFMKLSRCDRCCSFGTSLMYVQ